MRDSIETAVSDFLRRTLAGGAVRVQELETRARAASLLGNRQRITHSKLFARAKSSLGVKSIRAGFGVGGGWLWEMPRKATGPSAPSAAPQPRPPEPPQPRPPQRIPAEWSRGVAALQYDQPPADVPGHRWRQFVADCAEFLGSHWAPRAAELGWDAVALFGCRRHHPLSFLGSAGLIWLLNGGQVIELHRTWAVVSIPVNKSQRIVYRRSLRAAEITLPWTAQK